MDHQGHSSFFRHIKKLLLPHFNIGTALLISIMILCAVGLVPRKTSDDQFTASDHTGDAALRGSCVLYQQMSYTPCAHHLTRRVPLPEEFVGIHLADLQSAYSDWQITSYHADEVYMEQTLPIFCPQHVVLSPDDQGFLCIWQNAYGNEMTLSRSLDIPLADFTDELQQQLRAGIGFDTLAALEQWLESAVS